MKDDQLLTKNHSTIDVMANYQSAIQKILKHEGGYSNHSMDRGKETYMGISRRWYPHWQGWVLIDRLKKEMTGKMPYSHVFKSSALKEMVSSFYYKTYWLDIKANQIRDQKLAEYMLDTTIMHGNQGKKIIQQGVNKQDAGLKVDGKFGPKTVQAIQEAESCTLRVDISRLRLGHLNRIIAKDKSQETFRKGWNTRVHVDPLVCSN